METGEKYNRLTAVRFIEKRPAYKNAKKLAPHWLFKCDCGKEIITNAYHVKYRNTKSCGCLNWETKSAMGKANATHGLYKGIGKRPERLNLVYRSIIQRCKDDSNPNYHNYGGRGIKCEWKSLEEFKKDMEDSYKLHTEIFGAKKTQIDRINNDGNYCKQNCRWVTPKENVRNRRCSVFINGIPQAEFAEKNNISLNKVSFRNKYNWDEDEIIKGKHHNNIGERSHNEINNLEFKKGIMEIFKKNADIVKLYFGVLTDREKYIMENRLGLIDSKRMTLDEIGKELKITRERVRQIEAKSLKKLQGIDRDLTR